MRLDLSAILDEPLPPGTKGLPAVPAGFAVSDVAAQKWNLLAGDVTMPVATLRTDVMSANIERLQRYIGDKGASLAPHGKTTMCPQLFDRQLEAGAWGITVATIAQARLCHAVGVPRVLLANELVGEAEIAAFASMHVDAPDRELLVLVDSTEGARRLQDGFVAAGGGTRAQVLIEVGMRGGRCGVRSVEEAIALAETVKGLDRLDLRGIEGYEGLIVTSDPVRDAAHVNLYLNALVAVVGAFIERNLFAAGGRPIVSAGGSVYYDLVAALARRGIAEHAHLVVRSGCYVTQDSGFYRRASESIRQRDHSGEPPVLGSALQVWARVLSLPEPGRAILSAGKRDVSFDIDLPKPEQVFRIGLMDEPEPIRGWAITQLSDQHAFATHTQEDSTPLQIGDIVALGISHPCTTFDRWPVLLEIDARHQVVGAVRTFF